MTKITIGARGSKLSLAYVERVKELLLKNNKIRIKELPIRWVHMDNSKLNPFSESAIFFINFFKLLIKYKLKR